MISNQTNVENKIHPSNFREWERHIHSRFINYKPSVNIEIKTQKYHLSTAVSLKELADLFQMRHHIFFNETGISNSPDLDIDEFDSVCDHLVIRSNETGEICATYRLLTHSTSKKFYSEEEFNLSEFLAIPGVKLELGRACIHPNHRNGSLKDLLWRGIGAYAIKINADILFGCSSVMVTSPQVVSNILNLLKEKNIHSEEYNIQPREKYYFDYLDMPHNEIEDKKMLFHFLPPLLKSYINAGAKFYGLPALDEKFKCTDFFTVLFLNNLTQSFRNRYVNRENVL